MKSSFVACEKRCIQSLQKVLRAGATAGLPSSDKTGGTSNALLGKPAVAPCGISPRSCLAKSSETPILLGRSLQVASGRLLFILILLTSMGASCQQVVNQYREPTVRALPQTPALADVIRVVNENSSRIRTLHTTKASISSAMFPTVSANIAVERPGRIRLRAEHAFTGPEVDLGSNDDLFWVWVNRDPAKAVYYCRHAQFQTSNLARSFPLDPAWLIEALGVTSLDPNGEHRGPYPVGDGRLRVETVRQTAGGTMTKVTVVDEIRGWVLEQHLFDQQGQRLASAIASDHRRDPLTNATLPRHIELQWRTNELALKIDIAEIEINTLTASDVQLWAKPEYPGYANMDICDPNTRLPLPGMPGMAPQGMHPGPPVLVRKPVIEAPGQLRR